MPLTELLCSLAECETQEQFNEAVAGFRPESRQDVAYGSKLVKQFNAAREVPFNEDEAITYGAKVNGVDNPLDSREE